MIEHFNAINIECLMEREVEKPKLGDDGSFYIIYSLEKPRLRPRDSAMLNLSKGKLTRQNRGNDRAII